MRHVTFIIPCLSIVSFAWFSASFAADASPEYADPPMPAYRVDADGFEASERDIRAVCDSAGREVWRYFSDFDVEPFVVTRGHSGPIVLHERNEDDVIAKRQGMYEIFEKGLPAFYQEHKEELRSNPNVRELNGAMSIVMLRLFEEDPSRWEAVRWINSGPDAQNESLTDYLQRWHDAVPNRHRAFVGQLAELFGQQLISDPAQ